MKTVFVLLVSVIAGVTVAQAAPATFESPIVVVSPIAPPSVSHQIAVIQPALAGQVQPETGPKDRLVAAPPLAAATSERPTVIVPSRKRWALNRLMGHWWWLERLGRFDQP